MSPTSLMTIHFHSKEPIRRITTEQWQLAFNEDVVRQVKEDTIVGKGSHLVWYADSHDTLAAVIGPEKPGVVSTPSTKGDGGTTKPTTKPTTTTPSTPVTLEMVYARLGEVKTLIESRLPPITVGKPRYR